MNDHDVCFSLIVIFDIRRYFDFKHLALSCNTIGMADCNVQ